MAKTQPLAFPVRLPDVIQADALRLLNASQDAINALIIQLWEHLDDFVTDRIGPAWKQVERYALARSGHGNRQERCEMEQAGRVLRAHATRKQMFLTILPLLTIDLILPAEGKRSARKDHRVIRDKVSALRAEMEEADTFLGLVNVVEQACNVYLDKGEFPQKYEALQALPVLRVGQLTYAGDDGMIAGSTYRIRTEERGEYCDLRTRQEHPAGMYWLLRLRGPNTEGQWRWPPEEIALLLPITAATYLRQGAMPLAPTLREMVRDDESRVAVLDVIIDVSAPLLPPLEREQRVLGFDWGLRSFLTVSVLTQTDGDEPSQQISRPVFLHTGGIDGRQSRLRREIDRLKNRQNYYQTLITKALKAWDEQKVPLPAHYSLWHAKVAECRQQITICWSKYGRRNRGLAHLGANVLALFALLYDCHLICGENLKSLKVQGRGKGVRGRFRHWRINSQVRGELWRVLKYKCSLLGIRARQEFPRDTSHGCPRCGHRAQTYRCPAKTQRQPVVDWGAWLGCGVCGWSGSRDYAASVNIARLGMAFLTTYQRTQRYQSYRVTSPEVKPALYTKVGAWLLLPMQGTTPALPKSKEVVSYAGWKRSTALRTSQPRALLSILSTAQCRKQVLQQARMKVA